MLSIASLSSAEADPVDTSPPDATPQAQPPPSPSSSPQPHLQSGRVLTTPAVRKMAAERGIDLSQVPGSGKEGRVLKEDLLRHVEGEKGETELLVLSLHSQLLGRFFHVPGFSTPAFISG